MVLSGYLVADTTTCYSIIVRVQKGFCMAVKFYVKRISLKANRFVFW